MKATGRNTTAELDRVAQGVDRQLKAWVDGELSPAAARRVEAWVRESADARAAVEDYRRISRAIRRAGQQLPVPDLSAADVLLDVRRREAAERRTIAGLKRVAAAAAVFLVAATLALVLSSTGAVPVAGDDGVLTRGADRGDDAIVESAAREAPQAAALDVAQALAWAIDDGHHWAEDWR